jgi:hypothetical protein
MSADDLSGSIVGLSFKLSEIEIIELIVFNDLIDSTMKKLCAEGAKLKSERLLKVLSGMCNRIEVSGAVRMELPDTSILKFVVDPIREKDLFEDGRIVPLIEWFEKYSSGKIPRTKATYQMDGFRVKLVMADERNWISALYGSSSSFDYVVSSFTAAACRGLKWNGDVFLSKQDGKLIQTITDERVLMEKLGFPYAPPQERLSYPLFPESESGQRTMDREEFAEWVQSVNWVDTRCGGDPHQYSFRNAFSGNTEFVRAMETIMAYGYDERYYGRPWRYLDLDGYSYFTNGYDPYVTSLINRKMLSIRDHTTNEHTLPRQWRRSQTKWRWTAIDPRLPESTIQRLLGNDL